MPRWRAAVGRRRAVAPAMAPTPLVLRLAPHCRTRARSIPTVATQVMVRRPSAPALGREPGPHRRKAAAGPSPARRCARSCTPASAEHVGARPLLEHVRQRSARAARRARRAAHHRLVHRPRDRRAADLNGQSSITISAGAYAVSDAAAFAVNPLSDVAVSFFVVSQSGTTCHQSGFQTNYQANGDVAGDKTIRWQYQRQLLLPGRTSTYRARARRAPSWRWERRSRDGYHARTATTTSAGPTTSPRAW